MRTIDNVTEVPQQRLIGETRVKTIVHDIKGNAHKSALTAKMLRWAIENNLTDKIDIYLTIIETEAKLLAEQIEAVLETEYETPSKLNLLKWFAEIVEPYNREEEFITLKTEGKALITIEEKSLRLTINELITNAIRYSPTHSTIKIEVSNKEDLIIVISNECFNFNPDLLKTLFKERCKNESEFNSSGFGLMQLRQRIKEVGGTISVSHVNNLVAFTLKFIK